jgi:hypothetical protein
MTRLVIELTNRCNLRGLDLAPHERREVEVVI